MSVVHVAFVVVVASVGSVTGGCVATAVMSLWTKNTPRLIRRSPIKHRRRMEKACINTLTETSMWESGGEESDTGMVNS